MCIQRALPRLTYNYTYLFNLLNNFDYTRPLIKALYIQTLTGYFHFTQAGNDIVYRIYFRRDHLQSAD